MSLQRIDPSVPFDVASLNEPMAVAKRAVNRARATASDKVVVFGAGPIGLGVTILVQAPGRRARPRRRSAGGPAEEGARGRRRRRCRLLGRGRHAAPHRPARHGHQRPGGTARRHRHAAGAPQILNITQASAKWGARLVIVAVHKKPVDIAGILRSELTIIGSMGYPDELFEVTPVLAANWERFSKIISGRVPFSDVPSAYDLAITPGAADKVVVTFDD